MIVLIKHLNLFMNIIKNFISEIKKQIPQDWLSNNLNKIFSEYMKKQIKNDKKWEEILKEFENILEQQKKGIKGAISGLVPVELLCMETLVIIQKV